MCLTKFTNGNKSVNQQYPKIESARHLRRRVALGYRRTFGSPILTYLGFVHKAILPEAPKFIFAACTANDKIASSRMARTTVPKSLAEQIADLDDPTPKGLYLPLATKSFR